MRTLAVVAVASALIGGIAGASAALIVTSSSQQHPGRALSAPAEASSSASDGSVEERLANVERAVRALERRRSPLATLAAGVDGGAGAAPDRSGRPAGEGPALVDDPVFEAAVRDVIDRAEADRDSERELRREDRRKQAASRWVDDVTPSLRLNEQQKSKLLEIAQQFMSDVGRLWEGDGGMPPARAERRAEVQKLRDQAEQKLRESLDPSQVRAYDALSDDDKLGFPRRRGGADFGRDSPAPNR